MPSESEYLPVKYTVEIYEDSFVNDPSGYVETNAPLHSIQVGDYLSHETSDMWGAGVQVPDGHVLKVIARRHFLWKIEQKHVGHSLSVCVKAVPKPSDIF